MDALHVAYQILFIDWNCFLLIQGVSELFKSYWAATKGKWPGDGK